VSGAAWTAGHSGRAVALSGGGDYVSVPHAAMLDAYPLSVSAWFKSSAAGGLEGLVNKYEAGSFNGYQIFFNQGALCAWLIRDGSNYVYDGSDCTMRTSGYNDGLWHHVVFAVDAGGGRLYVDGVQKGSQPWTGAAGAASTLQALHLGDYPGATGGAFLSGVVDEVRIYDRGLSAQEVLQIYNEPTLP
jgi:hypothetical protein